ncbi:MATE family efflux transporter [Acinetobacter radioresistens]|uniref:MATE family efflux transporter n=1 Tax=Acinetobacter radioresistens TaxID=40216 RepID=UPI0022486992|nr:MATE family efflux transporter [Acinetobacter radioresistens]MCX0339643.1 MATE family efflux transporter [Acinetobacter radioresistens]
MRILGAAGAALLMYIMARFTDPTFIGKFQLILTVALGLSIIIRGGRDRAITKFIAQTESLEEQKNIFKICFNYIVKRIFYSLIISIVLYYFVGYFVSDISTYLWGLEFVILTSITMLISGYYKGKFKPNISYIYDMGFVSLFSSLIFLLFYYLGFSKNYIYVSFLISYILIILIFFYKNNIFFQNKDYIPKVRDFNIDKQANNFMWMTFIVYIQQLIIVITLSYSLSLSDLGIFKVAEKVALLVGFFQSVITATYSPYFSKYYRLRDKKKIGDTINKCIKIGLIISIPILLIILVLGEEILKLFGKEFVKGYTILIILSLSQLINVLFSVSSIFLNQTNYTKISKNIVIITSFISIPLTFLLSKIFGSIGASWSLLLYNLILNLSFTYYAFKGYRKL